MEYIGYLAKSYSGYTVINRNNLFNFLLIIMSKLANEEKNQFIEDLTLIVGNTFRNEFKNYIFSKMPKSGLLDFL